MTKVPTTRIDRLLGSLGYGSRGEVAQIARARRIVLDGARVADVAKRQDDVTRTIVATVVGRVKVDGIERARRKTTENMTAYDYYLGGLDFYQRRRHSPDNIAQALIMKPRVLLLDEPFGALDPGIRKDMHELLLDLWQETRLTVFMVTHDLSEGFTLGTRILVFDKTRLDPHAPGAYGARVTYDIPLNTDRRAARTAIGELPTALGHLHIVNQGA